MILVCENEHCVDTIEEVPHTHVIANEVYVMMQIVHGDASFPIGVFLNPDKALRVYEEMVGDGVQREYTWYIDHKRDGAYPLDYVANPLPLDEGYAVLHVDSVEVSVRLYRMTIEGFQERYGEQ